jgi:hypothetical protein
MRVAGRVALVASVSVLSAGAMATSVGASPSGSSVAVVPCSDVTGVVSSGTADQRRVLLDVVSVLPLNVEEAVANTGQRAWPYWVKAPLFLAAKAGPITVSVPPQWRTRVAISWGNRSAYESVQQIAGCASKSSPGSSMWLAYVGGFFLRSTTTCFPLVFRTGGRKATVRFGVGTTCPVP